MRHKLEDICLEKEEFSTLLGKIVSKIDDGEKLMICGDLNGHVGAEVEGLRVCIEGLVKKIWKVK